MHGQTKRICLAATLAAGLWQGAPAAAQTLPPLGENPRVVAEFTAAAVADEIRKNCGSISARWIYFYQRARELEEYVRGLGYTEDDFRALRKDPEERARLRAMRNDYLAANGVVTGDGESYCRLGRTEMERGSLIGSLLR